MFFSRCLKRLVVAGVLYAFTLVAMAHPHAWIDVITVLVTNTQGKVVAIEQQWAYDDLLSSALLHDLKAKSVDQKPDVVEYARQAIEGLESYGYFMQITAGGKPVALGKASQLTGDVKKREIWIGFTVPFKKPVDPVATPIAIKVFDPTYFIEMLQNPDAPPTVRGAVGKNCTIQIEEPNPTAEDYAKALALDRGETAEPNFGDLFAQKVLVKCR